jgi:hypothetical protein
MELSRWVDGSQSSAMIAAGCMRCIWALGPGGAGRGMRKELRARMLPGTVALQREGPHHLWDLVPPNEPSAEGLVGVCQLNIKLQHAGVPPVLLLHAPQQPARRRRDAAAGAAALAAAAAAATGEGAEAAGAAGARGRPARGRGRRAEGSRVCACARTKQAPKAGPVPHQLAPGPPPQRLTLGTPVSSAPAAPRAAARR